MCVYNTIEISVSILIKIYFYHFFIIINYASSKKDLCSYLKQNKQLYMSWTSRCSLFHFVREWLDSWTGWTVCSNHTAGKDRGSNLFYPVTSYVTRRMSSLGQPWDTEEGHLLSPVNSWCPHSITGPAVGVKAGRQWNCHQEMCLCDGLQVSC